MATKTKKEKPIVATLIIKNCKECPFLKMERYYTEDSWETAFNWYCEKKENKMIAGYVNCTSNEEDSVEIPKWCPLSKTSKKSKR